MFSLFSLRNCYSTYTFINQSFKLYLSSTTQTNHNAIQSAIQVTTNFDTTSTTYCHISKHIQQQGSTESSNSSLYVTLKLKEMYIEK